MAPSHRVSPSPLLARAPLLARRAPALAGLLVCAAVLLHGPAPAAAGSISCTGQTLAANDDGWVTVPIGFPMKLGVGTYTDVHVANNGYVTFGATPPFNFDYNQLRLDTTSRPVIAPFLADVDTRNPASGLVTYGTSSDVTRPNFCVAWNDVGYFDSRADVKNSFQLLIVERSDRGLADFDIEFHYDTINWNQTTSFNTYVPPKAPTPTWGGFAPGGAFLVPGLGTVGNDYFDSGPSPLVAFSSSGAQPGTYAKSLSNGLEQASGVVAGVLLDPFGEPMPGASAQLCRSALGPCFTAVTDGTGTYTIYIPDVEIDGSAFSLDAMTAPGTSWFFPAPVQVTPIQSDTVLVPDQMFAGYNPPPAGTTLTPDLTTANGAPRIHWMQDPVTLTTQGPAGWNASFSVALASDPNTPVKGGPMDDSAAPGTYTGYFDALKPAHGWAIITTTLCPRVGAVIPTTA